MNSIKDEIKSLRPLSVRFYITFGTLKAIIEDYIFDKTGQYVKIDFKAIADTGRVLIDTADMSTEEKAIVKQTALATGYDDDMANDLDIVLEQYFGSPVSIYCNSMDEGCWNSLGFDVLMDFDLYLSKQNKV